MSDQQDVIVAQLQTLAQQVQQIVQQLQAGAGKFGRLESQIDNAITGFEKLDKILTSGNGQPSVLRQLERLQVEFGNLNTKVQAEVGAIHTKFAELASKIDLLAKQPVAERTAARQFWQAIIVTIISAGTTLFVAYLTSFNK